MNDTIKLDKILKKDEFKFVIDNPILHHSITEFIEYADKMLWTQNSIESEVKNKIFEYRESTVKYDEYLKEVRDQREWSEIFRNANNVNISDGELCDHEPTLFDLLSLINDSNLMVCIDEDTIEINHAKNNNWKYVNWDIEKSPSTIFKQIQSMIKDLNERN
jgi:hypothetical protein